MVPTIAKKDAAKEA
jgi:hypothetical protein